MIICIGAESESKFWIEVLKYSIGPIAALLAVFIGSHLNAYLTRKQKIRDELFSYKVKAYVDFAGAISDVENDYLNGLSQYENSETAPFDDDEYLGPLLMSTAFRKKYKENFLFFDDNIRKHAENLAERLYESSQLHLRAATYNDTPRYIIIDDNLKIRKTCEDLLKILYETIGLNKL